MSIETHEQCSDCKRKMMGETELDCDDYQPWDYDGVYKCVNQSPYEPQAAMVARIAKVRPSNGTDQDNIRASTEKLIAALGGPAVEFIEPEPQELISPETWASEVFTCKSTKAL